MWYYTTPLSPPESTNRETVDRPTRRGFLRSCLRTGIVLGELGVIGAGTYVLGRRAYHAILTGGMTDRRFIPEATLPQLEQAAIPFQALRDGETLLGKRITLPLREGKSIDVEAGFVSVATGRELRLRIPPHTFRVTDEWNGALVTQHILDVLRENRENIRLCSQYGAALIETARCADIARQLSLSSHRTFVMESIPFELRTPFVAHNKRDIHFERIDE